MPDIWTKEKRSEVMSRIRSVDTTPERAVRSMLHKSGYRFRLHRRDLPGKPDVVLPKFRAVVFIHGCFWHQHADCNEGRIPNTRPEYWVEKLQRTVQRDQEHQKKLQEAGWGVLVLWECEIEKRPDEVRVKIERFLKGKVA